jgi:hypothetical protein
MVTTAKEYIKNTFFLVKFKAINKNTENNGRAIGLYRKYPPISSLVSEVNARVVPQAGQGNPVNLYIGQPKSKIINRQIAKHIITEGIMCFFAVNDICVLKSASLPD